MAKQDTQTSQRESARGEQQGPLTRRSQYSPLALLRVSPFSLMRRMAEEMDRVFGDFSDAGVVWSPPIEITEREGNYVVRAELPGLKPEEVKAEVQGDALVIEGERKMEQKQEEGTVHRSERRYGHFYRMIPLPESAKADQARARFENGVLEVTIPVAEQPSNRRQIPIEAKAA